MNRNNRLAKITKELGRDFVEFSPEGMQRDLQIEYIKIDNSCTDLELELSLFERNICQTTI